MAARPPTGSGAGGSRPGGGVTARRDDEYVRRFEPTDLAGHGGSRSPSDVPLIQSNGVVIVRRSFIPFDTHAGPLRFPNGGPVSLDPIRFVTVIRCPTGND